MSGDPYWSNVVFLSGFEGGSVVDESPLAQTVTLTGTTAQSTAVSIFGSKVLARPGGGTGWASVPDNAAFTIGANPFTIEGFFQWTSFGATTNVENTLVQHGDNNGLSPLSFRFYMHHQNASSQTLRLSFDGDGTGYDNTTYISSSFALVVDTTYHMAVDYDGGTYRFYLDGACIGTAVASNTLSNATTAMVLGACVSAGAERSVYSKFNGYMDDVRVTVGIARYASDTGFTPIVTALERGPHYPHDYILAEMLGVADGSGYGPGALFLDAPAETVATQLDVSVGWLRELVSGMGASDLVNVVKGVAGDTTDTVSVSEALAFVLGALTQDAIRTADIADPSIIYTAALADTAALQELLSQALPAALIDAVGVSEALTILQAVLLQEVLGIAETVVGSAIYGLSWQDQVRFMDALARFFSGDVTEGLGIQDNIVTNALLAAALSETAGVNDALSPLLILRAVVSDTASVTDASLARMIFSGTLIDGVEVSAAYIAPGNITSWAVNTRTGAASEYSNFEFNSFAQMGMQYIAASDAGLYELRGDDDAGTSIVSRIKSGFAQFAGSHLNSFKAAYLGVRGGGDYVLRLITGDGKTYDYGVKAEDMATTKVALGKGLRARYFAFELISAGQDFDLDSVEFIPLVAQRRV